MSKNINTDTLVKGAKGVIISLVFGLSGYLIMFFFNLFGARYFGASQWGLYALSNTILRIFSAVVSLGLFNAFTIYIPEYLAKKQNSELKGLISFVLYLTLGFSFIISLLLFIFSNKLTSFFNYPEVFSLIIKLTAILGFVKTIHAFFRKLFVGTKRFLSLNVVYSLIDKLFLIFALFFCFLLNLNVEFMILLITVASFIIVFISFFLAKKFLKKYFFNKNKKTYLSKEWFLFSLPLFFTGIFSFFLNWTDNLVIGKFMQPADLAVYSIAYSLANFLIYVQNSFSTVINPYLSGLFHEKKFFEMKFVYKKFSAWVFGLSFPLFLIMLLYSKELLRLLYGREFESGFLPLMIIALGILINFSLGLNNSIIMVHKKTKYFFWINFILAFVNFGLTLLLVPLIGMVGAAISSALMMVLQQLLLFIKARHLEKNLSLDWVYLIKFVVAGVISALLATNMFRLGLNPYLALLISGFFYVALYLLLLLAFRTFRSEDYELFLIIEKKLGLNLVSVKKLVKLIIRQK